LSAFRNAHNSALFSSLAEPTGFYKLLPFYESEHYILRSPSRDSIAPQQAQSDKNEIDDDFEVIDFDEVSSRSSSPSGEIVKEICENCHAESAGFTVPTLCGHKFCSKCLRTEFLRRLEQATETRPKSDERDEFAGMECLKCDCVFGLEIHALQLVLPLPIANLYALIHFCNSRAGLLCDECPGCKNLVVVESNGKKIRDRITR